MARLPALFQGLRAYIRGDARYRTLDPHEYSTSEPWGEKAKNKVASAARRGRTTVVAFGAFVLASFFLLATIGPLNGDLHTKYNVTTISDNPVYLRVIVPATNADESLCKTIFSAAILDYTSPTLVNWAKEFKYPDSTTAQIVKLSGVLNHLNTLKPENDEDIILLVNDPSLWFQLRPQVFLQRYYDINRQANERIHRQLGRGMEVEGISQSVLFSSQSTCQPLSVDQPACYAVPEVAHEQNRYLDDRVVVGPLKAVKAIIEHALQMAATDTTFENELSIFASIYGEQEFQRQCISRRHRTPMQQRWDTLGKRLGLRTSVLDQVASGSLQGPDCAEGTHFEFSLGLDHSSQLSQLSNPSLGETTWLQHDGKGGEGSKQETHHHNVPPPPHLGSLANDISRSIPPFTTLRGPSFPSGNLPSSLSTWSQIPLLTHLPTGTTPATISQAKSDAWTQTWFHPHLRTLLDAHVLEPARPILVALPDGRNKAFWGVVFDSGWTERAGVLTDRREFLSYEGLCKNVWEGLFGDEKGPWRDPRY